jgi:hypothetical protein
MPCFVTRVPCVKVNGSLVEIGRRTPCPALPMTPVGGAHTKRALMPATMAARILRVWCMQMTLGWADGLLLGGEPRGWRALARPMSTYP